YKKEGGETCGVAIGRERTRRRRRGGAASPRGPRRPPAAPRGRPRRQPPPRPRARTPRRPPAPPRAPRPPARRRTPPPPPPDRRRAGCPADRLEPGRIDHQPVLDSLPRPAEPTPNHRALCDRGRGERGALQRLARGTDQKHRRQDRDVPLAPGQAASVLSRDAG